MCKLDTHLIATYRSQPKGKFRECNVSAEGYVG